MKIALEAFSRALFDEILPLAQACWDENTRLKAETCAYYGERDFKVEPDFERYDAMNKQGALVVATMRLHLPAEYLVAYAVGMLYRSLHHRLVVCGGADSIYVAPAVRSYAPVLVEVFEKRLFELGAQIISWPTHPASPVYEVLKARGYVGDDVIMEKRPCA